MEVEGELNLQSNHPEMDAPSLPLLQTIRNEHKNRKICMHSNEQVKQDLQILEAIRIYFKINI
jgi:hypothetical protein